MNPCRFLQCVRAVHFHTLHLAEASKAEADAAWKAGDLDTFNRALERHYAQLIHARQVTGPRLDALCEDVEP